MNDWPWRPGDNRIHRYEDRPGPLHGRRGVYAHLDPVTPPAELELIRPGADVDYPEVYQLACKSARYASIAETALNLLGELYRHPGNQLLVQRRAQELRRQLDSLDP